MLRRETINLRRVSLAAGSVLRCVCFAGKVLRRAINLKCERSQIAGVWLNLKRAIGQISGGAAGFLNLRINFKARNFASQNFICDHEPFMSADTRNFAKQNFGGLNFTAAIFKFTRLKLTDLR